MALCYNNHVAGVIRHVAVHFGHTLKCLRRHLQWRIICVTQVPWTALSSLQTRAHDPSNHLRLPDKSPRGQPLIRPSCVIMVHRRIPTDTIHSLQNSGLVLTTNGATLIKRCIGQAVQAANLQAGVYQQQLPFPCSLHGQDWALKATFSR